MSDQAWRRRLSSHRRAVRLTQADLAKEAGVSLGAIKAYEQGLRDPSRDVLISILDALKLDRGSRNQLLNRFSRRGVLRDDGVAFGAESDWPDGRAVACFT